MNRNLKLNIYFKAISPSNMSRSASKMSTIREGLKQTLKDPKDGLKNSQSTSKVSPMDQFPDLSTPPNKADLMINSTDTQNQQNSGMNATANFDAVNTQQPQQQANYYDQTNAYNQNYQYDQYGQYDQYVQCDQYGNPVNNLNCNYDPNQYYQNQQYEDQNGKFDQYFDPSSQNNEYVPQQDQYYNGTDGQYYNNSSYNYNDPTGQYYNQTNNLNVQYDSQQGGSRSASPNNQNSGSSFFNYNVVRGKNVNDTNQEWI